LPNCTEIGCKPEELGIYNTGKYDGECKKGYTRENLERDRNNCRRHCASDESTPDENTTTKKNIKCNCYYAGKFLKISNTSQVSYHYTSNV